MLKSVARKLLFSFLLIALVASASGIVGLLAIGQVSEQVARSLGLDVPLFATVERTNREIEQIGTGVQTYLREAKIRPEAKKAIEATLARARMYAAALQRGTRDPAFLATPAAAEWRASGQGTELSAGLQGDAQTLLSQVATGLDQLGQAVSEAVNASDTQAQFSFVYQHKGFDVATFAYFLKARLAAWVDLLNDSVEFNAEFTGGTNPGDIDFARWSAQYRTKDAGLAALLADYAKLNARIYATAAQIVAADSVENKQSILEKQRGLSIQQASHKLDEIVQYVLPVVTKAEQDQAAALRTLDAGLAALGAATARLEAQMATNLRDSGEAVLRIQDAARTIIGAAVAAGLVLSLIVAWWAGRSIAKPLALLIAAIRRLATHDLSDHLPPTLATQPDELGDMARAIAVFRNQIIATTAAEAEQEALKLAAEARRVQSLQDMAERIERETATAVEEISVSAEALIVQANDLASSADRVSNEANAVAGSTGEAMGSVETVAAAGEQLAMSVREVASQIARAAADTTQAAQLGHNTARSTENIGLTSTRIQSVTQRAVDVTGQLIARVEALQTMTGSVAASAEQQTAATAEIARSVSESALAVRAVSSRVTSVSDEATLARNAVSEVRSVAEQVGTSIQSLRSTLVSVVRTSSDAVNRRRDPRYAADFSTTAKLSDGQTVTVRCLDLSLGGAHLETNTGLPDAAIIRLRLPGAGEVSSRVVAGGPTPHLQFLTLTESQRTAITSMLVPATAAAA
eukprot:gene12901-13002_t